MKITPQIWRTKNGERLITYAVYYNGVFAGYSRCLCAAMKAAQWLSITLR